MRKRISIGLSLAAVLLVIANLAVARWRAEPRFVVDAGEVERIEIRYADRDTLMEPEPVMQEDRYRTITIREDIERVCDVLATMYVREFEMEPEETAWNHITTVVTRGTRYIFSLKDGTTRTIEGVCGYTVLFDGHWCYVSCGKKYGYVPLLRELAEVENRAERIEPERRDVPAGD